MAEGEAEETPSTALVTVSPLSTLVAEDPALEAAIKLLESLVLLLRLVAVRFVGEVGEVVRGIALICEQHQMRAR